MTLSITQRILCELHTVGAMTEQTGLSGKDIADLLDTKQAPARLVELRKQGFVKSSDRSTGTMRFWLTPAGETYAIELKHYAGESKQDQSTDANCDQANNNNGNNKLIDVDDTNVADNQAIPEGFTPWDGGECPVPTGTLVDVIYRDGRITRNAKALMNMDGFTRDAGHYFWQHDSMICDIIAYRLSEPATDNVYQAENSDQLDEKLDIPAPAYNPPYEMMGVHTLLGSKLIDGVVAVKPEIPPPQYNPDDVAFKKGDIAESWYMVDGIDAQFETSSDAIAAAHDYVTTHTMSTTVHIVASRKFAVIKPVVTTELEYL